MRDEPMLTYRLKEYEVCQSLHAGARRYQKRKQAVRDFQTGLRRKEIKETQRP
ncbi:hypothetical protein [Oceanobacillus luteolus]